MSAALDDAANVTRSVEHAPAVRARGRLTPPTLAALTVFACAYLLIVSAPRIPVAEVSTSANLDTARFGPEKTFDRCGVEAPGTLCFWLLPDRTTGWIRYDFADEYHIDRLSILNTMNDVHADRSAGRIRIEWIGSALPQAVETLPAYPKWFSHDYGGATARGVVIHIDSITGLGGGLNEVVVEGTSATFPERALRWLAALVLAATAGFLFWRFPLEWRSPTTRSRFALCALAIALVVVGWRFLHYASSVSTFEWLLIFDPREIDTFAKAKDFFRDLVVPIPPVLAFVELLAYRFTGSADLVTRGLYKAAIVGSYLAALALAYPSIRRMVATFAIAVVFIASTAAVHPGNPQIYDVVFPALLNAFVLTVAWARKRPHHPRTSPMVWFVAGLLLALLGLTRPFGIVLVPFAVLVVGLRLTLGDRRRRELLAFVIPIVVLFGGWHWQLYSAHRQLTMSNNTGFNLVRAWPDAPVPAILPEAFSPPFRAVNNPAHGINSRMLTRAVADYVLGHPRAATLNLMKRFAELTEPRTRMVDVVFTRPTPVDDWLGLYAIVLRAVVAIFAIVGVQRAYAAIRRRLGAIPPRVSADESLATDLLLLLTAGCAFMTMFGESGDEDARFMIELLPMLAVTPALVPAGGLFAPRAAAIAPEREFGSAVGMDSVP